MTLEEVKKRIVFITSLGPDGQHDDERAHIEEDKLYHHILIAIAEKRLSLDEAAEICKEALKTKDIDFSRWCA